MEATSKRDSMERYWQLNSTSGLLASNSLNIRPMTAPPCTSGECLGRDRRTQLVITA